MDEHKNALSRGTVLDNRYRLEAVLGAGGFGIVYRAVHTHLEKPCAIKEYLPQEIALREGTTVHPLSSASETDYEEGRQRFLQEARQLVQFSAHPHIVTCSDFFEANGTAYLVMDYEDGLPLSDLLAGREQQGRPLSEAEILGLLRPVVQGLDYVHGRDVLHRDIKPGNIFIRRADEQPVLLDFGAAKVGFSRHTKSRAALTPGYAAPEQVEDEGSLGPWTDIYAIGALLWRVVTGDNPPSVESRMRALMRDRPDPLALDAEAGGGRFSEGFLQLIAECVELDEEKRLQSAGELLARMEALGAGAVAPASVAKPPAMAAGPVSAPPAGSPQAPPSPSSGRYRPGRKTAIAAILIAAAVGLGALAAGGGIAPDRLAALWDELKPMSAEERAELESRAITLQSEVNTLQRRLDNRKRDLEQAIRDAGRDDDIEQERRLEDWRQLVDQHVVDGVRQAGYEGLARVGERRLRGEDYEAAIAAYAEAREGLAQLLEDFAAAEELVEIRPGVEALRQAWRAHDATWPVGEAVESDYQVAVAAFEASELSAALGRYREVEPQFTRLNEMMTELERMDAELAGSPDEWTSSLADMALDAPASMEDLRTRVQRLHDLLDARQASAGTENDWNAVREEYGLEPPEAAQRATDYQHQAARAEAEGDLLVAVEKWQQSESAWQEALEDTAGQVAEIDRERAEARRRAEEERRRREEEARVARIQRAIEQREARLRNLRERAEELQTEMRRAEEHAVVTRNNLSLPVRDPDSAARRVVLGFESPEEWCFNRNAGGYDSDPYRRCIRSGGWLDREIDRAAARIRDANRNYEPASQRYREVQGEIERIEKEIQDREEEL